MIRYYTIIAMMIMAFLRCVYSHEIVMAAYDGIHSNVINESSAIKINDEEIENIVISDKENFGTVVSIEFKGSGIGKNAAFTRNNIGNRIALSINGSIISRPVIIEPSGKITIITTSLTRGDLDKILKLRNSAQQVDSAEPSTNAVPPSIPTGSAR